MQLTNSEIFRLSFEDIFLGTLYLYLHYTTLYLHLYKQDAREAMRVVFCCTYKTYLYAQKKEFLMNIFKYCLKNYIKLNEFVNCNLANNYDV